MNDVYAKENSDLLKQILDTMFFNRWKEDNKVDISHSLELQITDDCNLKCEYCYVHRYGDLLYPKEIRKHETILNNIEIVLDYFIENKLYPGIIDLFSGEIWGSPFGFEVLNKILEKLKICKIATKIIIPSNMTFLLKKGYEELIQGLIDEFAKIGVRLIFSASIDGLPLETEQRSFKNEKKNNLRNSDYYETVFKFCNKNYFNFHPMIAASSIEKWIDNYKWWITMFQSYERDINDLMTLEVRNNDWSSEKISLYLEFLEHIYNYKFHTLFHSDLLEFTKYVFRLYEDTYTRSRPNNLSILYDDARYSCAVQYQLYIRMGDLKITPCHRTSYNQFNYGKFIVNDNKIVDIVAENVELAAKILLGNPIYTQDGCDSCAYNKLCMKGCLGAQYEENGFIFMPCENVCCLTKAKTDFLLHKFNEDGVLKILFNTHFYNGDNSNRIKECIKDYFNYKGDVLNV